jgi:F-type H+-transporting ATPase subunit epsilon
MKTFACEGVTPDGQFFNGELVSVQAPGVSGSFEILLNHAPFISALGTGKLTLTLKDQQKQAWQLTGGLLEVNQNRVSVLAERVTRL